VWDYLFGAGTAQAMAFELAFSQMVDDVLPFELLADQMPSRFYRGEREFKIDFRRIGDEHLDAVLIIVRDITVVVEAEKREADFRQIHQAMQVLSRDRDGFRKGLDELDRLLTELERNWCDDVEHRRTLHTIKGSAAVLGFSGVANACHAIEDMLEDEPARVTGASFTSVRTVWLLMLSQIETFLGDDHAIRIEVSDYEQLIGKLRARRDHDELLSLVRSFLDEPTRGPLNRLAAQAARVAEQLGKAVEIAVVDNDVRLPANRCDGLWISAIHLVRNAIDHGIEAPLARRAVGKSVVGTLTITTAIVDDALVVSFADDGGGIDWERVRHKASEAGLPARSDADLVDALFADGLSTRDEANGWSGRGLGMAAVKAAVGAFSGTIDVQSTRAGTTVTLRLPMSSLRGDDAPMALHRTSEAA
jgi:chemotaxis protein histidine kinase CheA